MPSDSTGGFSGGPDVGQGIPVVQAYVQPSGTRAAPQPAGIYEENVAPKGMITLGAVGHFVFAGTALTFGIAQLSTSYYFQDYNFSNLYTVFAVGLVFFVGLLLQSLGFLALGRGWRSVMGYATFAFGIIAAIIFIVALSFRTLGINPNCHYGNCYYYPPAWAAIAYLAGEIILGVLFIIGGSTYIVSGKILGNQSPSTIAGTLSIVGGSLMCTFFLSSIGLFLVAPSSIIAGITLAMAPRPPAGNVGSTVSGAHKERY